MVEVVARNGLVKSSEKITTKGTCKEKMLFICLKGFCKSKNHGKEGWVVGLFTNFGNDEDN